MSKLMHREYFYKNSKGEVVPYHYCSECSKQYTNEDFEQGLIVNVGSNVTPIKYCVKPCLDIKFPNMKLSATYPSKRLFTREIEKVIEEKVIPKEIVEILESEEVLEDTSDEEIPQKKPIKTQEIKPSSPLEEDLKKLSARQIIEKVKAEKGVEITGDLKSKKVIIRKALKVYAETIKAPVTTVKAETSHLEEELKNLSGRQIIEKVKTEKSIAITCSVKSKRVIIQKALKIYGGKL